MSFDPRSEQWGKRCHGLRRARVTGVPRVKIMPLGPRGNNVSHPQPLSRIAATLLAALDTTPRRTIELAERSGLKYGQVLSAIRTLAAKGLVVRCNADGSWRRP